MRRSWCAVVCLAAALLLASYGAGARDAPQPLSAVAAVTLPAEARSTLELIASGGPYPYERDGIVFANREHRLPSHPRGYYHEYTVKTPGERTRGVRRVICGGPLRSVAECYYTDDHYQSFRRIRL